MDGARGVEGAEASLVDQGGQMEGNGTWLEHGLSSPGNARV